MKINRRAVVFGGLGLVGLAGLGVWGLGRPALESRVVSMLHRRLSYLQLDESGVHAFAHDQVSALLNKKIPTWNRMKYHFQSVFGPGFTRFSRSADQRSRAVKAEDPIVSLYLLSTDFFINGADESRPVSYVAYFEPIRACSNPFARRVLAT